MTSACIHIWVLPGNLGHLWNETCRLCGETRKVERDSDPESYIAKNNSMKDAHSRYAQYVSEFEERTGITVEREEPVKVIGTEDVGSDIDPGDADMSIKEYVEALVERGWTKVAIAKKLGVKSQTLYGWIRGVRARSAPGRGALIKLKRIYESGEVNGTIDGRRNWRWGKSVVTNEMPATEPTETQYGNDDGSEVIAAALLEVSAEGTVGNNGSESTPDGLEDNVMLWTGDATKLSITGSTVMASLCDIEKMLMERILDLEQERDAVSVVKSIVRRMEAQDD